VNVSASNPTETVYCFFAVSSPNSLGPGTITGNCLLFNHPECSAYGYVAWNNSAFNGNGHWLETTAQCNSAINDTESRGNSWGQNYVTTHVESGGTLAAGPSVSDSNVGCNPGPGSTQQWFTATSTANAWGLAYRKADAQAVARARLNANALPSGYTWTFQSVCAPSVSGRNGDTLHISCGENGVAAFNWDPSAKSALASKLAFLAVTTATNDCNATSGVASGSCSIIVQQGSTMPSAANITINVTTPNAAAPPATVAGLVPIMNAFSGANWLPLATLTLLGLACGGIARRRAHLLTRFGTRTEGH